MPAILDFVFMLISSIINWILNIFDFIKSFLFDFPYFVTKIIDQLPDFVRSGITTIVICICTVFALKVIKHIKETVL